MHVIAHEEQYDRIMIGFDHEGDDNPQLIAVRGYVTCDGCGARQQYGFRFIHLTDGTSRAACVECPAV